MCITACRPRPTISSGIAARCASGSACRSSFTGSMRGMRRATALKTRRGVLATRRLQPWRARMPGGRRPSIALGHHADDQVETLLLALSRGAGLPGLAAMPAHAARHGLDIYRPLLAVSAADIRAWLAARDLPWIEDPSNGDARYTRNRIRAVLLPALEQAFPQFRTTFARSIGHAAQAQQLLVELAAQDLQTVGEPPHIKALQALSRARQANVLRHWLMQAHGCAPSTAQLDQLLDQVRACTTRGHRIHLKVAGGFAERKGDRLHWYNAPPSPKT
jgi:tRNA(Ile)-lysidine synthase